MFSCFSYVKQKHLKNLTRLVLHFRNIPCLDRASLICSSITLLGKIGRYFIGFLIGKCCFTNFLGFYFRSKTTPFFFLLCFHFKNGIISSQIFYPFICGSISLTAPFLHIQHTHILAS